MMRPILLTALALFFTACGGSQPAPTNDPGACTPEECGPAPTTPETLCEDGVSMGGQSSTCTRDANGVCGYATRTCPQSVTPPPPEPRACGGMSPDQNACPEGEFCDFPREATCGAADAPGVCRARPEACTEELAPVCGCDDHTYPNACAAAAAGVSVGADGECPQRFGAAGDTCGTRGAPQCGEGLFCNFPATADCGRADAPGTCTAKPAECTGRARPVCGCDGTTYPSACAANQAGVTVETTRACRPAR